MATMPFIGTQSAQARPTEHVPDIADNLALMLSARRRRRLRRSAWTTR